MNRLSALAIIFVAFAVCAQNPARQSHDASVISFVETNDIGQQIRLLSFVLTNQPAKTCIAGNWKIAKALSGDITYTKNPAYTFNHRRLEVLLVNEKCDVYDSYIGDLINGQFHGEHVAYGLGFNKMLGKVSGSYANK